MTNVLVEVVDDQIWARWPWLGERALSVISTIQAGRWYKELNVRKYPLNWDTCLEIRRVADRLGIDIDFGDNMIEWAAEEKKRQANAPSVTKPPSDPYRTPILERRNRRIWEAIQARPFQTVTPLFVAVRRAALLADDPGLGKTIQTCASFEEAEQFGPILVIAPKSAIQITWPQQLQEWLPNDKFGILGPHIPAVQRDGILQMVHDECAMDPTLRYWVLTTSYYVRLLAETDDYGKFVYEEGSKRVKKVKCNLPSMFDYEWSGIVIDESHRFVAAATGNAKKMSAQMQGLYALQLAEQGIKLALSGTPMRSKPANLFGTLAWLRPDIFTSYWKWADRYFELYEEEGGSKTLGALKNKKRFYKDASNILIRREKGEVASDLPPKLYAGEHLIKGDKNSALGIWLPMEGKQLKAYQEMERSAAAQLTSNKLPATGILAEMNRLKQFASSLYDMTQDKKWKKYKDDEVIEMFYDLMEEYPDEDPKELSNQVPTGRWTVVQNVFPLDESNKFDWIIEFLTDRGIAGPDPCGNGKVIIASQFTKLLNHWHKMLLEKHGVESYLLTGETSESKRRAAQKGFQQEDGGLRVFFTNTIAGGVSITLDRADDVVIVDETWNADDQLQVEDRAHRLSRTDHDVTIWYLRTLGTIEESIGATNTEREATCKGIMDGERGLNIAKRLLHVQEEAPAAS